MTNVKADKGFWNILISGLHHNPDADCSILKSGGKTYFIFKDLKIESPWEECVRYE